MLFMSFMQGDWSLIQSAYSSRFTSLKMHGDMGFREAKIEFGEAVASRLKLSSDGTKILWPQPTDSPLDPQNWSDRRKALQLFIITLAAIVPDFDSGIGMFSPF